MADKEIVDAGMLVVSGGALKHLLDYGLRVFRARGQAMDMETERELKLSHSSIEYANTLRGDIGEQRKEIGELRREIAELRDLVKGLYQRNDELRRQNEEYARHLSICKLAIA